MGVDSHNDHKDQYFYLSTLARGLKIIELLAQEGELAVSDVARQLGINRTSSHRYLATLKEEGYTRQSKDSRYRLTYKVFELGQRIVERYSIREEAWPFMQELLNEYNETVDFACLDAGDVIYLDKAESSEVMRIDTPMGSRGPAYCTALGKAILAFLPQEDFDDYIEQTTLEAFTQNTITDKAKLIEELAHVKKAGLAVDNEEFSIGLRSVGAPILDVRGHARFAISVSGVASRMPADRLERIKSSVQAVCEELSLRAV